MPQHVLGVLAGKDMPPELLRKWVGSAEILIAADGGADSILAAGFKPDAIVGDLDSLSEAARLCGCELHKITDQNYTDCDKLLRYVQDRELLPITLAGIEGDRIDHVLGSLYSVAASGFMTGSLSHFADHWAG